MIRGIKQLERRNLQCSMDVSIHNRFDIEVIDSVTGEKKQTAQAYNTICNGLWGCISKQQNYFQYIVYGSGTGTPSPSDSALFNKVGYKEATSLSWKQDVLSGLISAQKRISILENEKVGVTLTEVGIQFDSSTLCTHAMLVDMNNNPISILKTDTDIINIYATIFLHYSPYGYDKGSIKINPDVGTGNSSIFLKLTGITIGKYYTLSRYSLSNTNRTDNGYSVGKHYTYDVVLRETFDLDTHILTLKADRLSADKCDAPGFCTAMITGTNPNSAYSYSWPEITCFVGGDWYPKSQIQDEAVGTGDGVSQDFDLKFPYASNVKLYLDGKETTDFTYNYMIPGVTNIGSHNRCFCIWLDKKSTKDLLIPAVSGYKKTVDMFFNPMYEIGIKQIRAQNISSSSSTPLVIEASNDLQTWDDINSTQVGNYWWSIPEKYKNYKYFRTNQEFGYYASTDYYDLVKFPDDFTGKAIHFNTPPADGVTITADYDSKSVAKDTDHVFDFSLKINLGEYTEAQ